jgi:hypothetical protein
VDDRFEIIEIWRQSLRDQPEAAVRVLARSEAGSDGPDEYAVGITTKADAHLYPMGDEKDLFTGLSFAEGHWLAAILVSATRNVEEAESLLFDLRMPVELTWRDIELAPEVIEPNGLRSQPLVPWHPEGPTSQRAFAIATYTLDCGHQAVELLRQDAESAPFWLEEGAVDHLAARDARSLARLLLDATTLDEAHALIESARENLATHPDDDDDDDDDHNHDHDDDDHRHD